MAVDFAIICSLVRPGRPRYPVLVHRAATLLHASSGRRLAMTPLRFANPSPPSGWIEDFHLQAVDHARHTEKTPHRAGFKEGSQPSLEDCNYQRTRFEVEIEELLYPISSTYAVLQSRDLSKP
jgi:hypothetical protein